MNSFIELLGSRNSFPRLSEPAPKPAELTQVFEAALRVPDHMQLRPWRFLTVQGEDREALGKLFAKAEQAKNPTANQEELNKKAAKALRAPLIIVGICSYQEHEKVPLIEQQLSTGCVLHNLGLAFYSLGYGSVWRTGSFAFNADINQALGLVSHESIMGYLYVGSHDGKAKTMKALELNNYLQSWPSK